MTAVLKTVVSGFLLSLSDETHPSAAASRTAAGVPNTRMARKIKVSETETVPLARGILIVIREPTPKVKTTRNRYLRVRTSAVRARSEIRETAAPPAIINHWYAFARL